jgi:REP element-mobilizing transposase RayT
MNKENLPKRKNIRLNNYDYSEPGTYFITICTKNKEKLLWNGELDTQNFDWKLVGEQSFYDHIIRNKHDYEEISKYIHENPLKWQFDELYS